MANNMVGSETDTDQVESLRRVESLAANWTRNVIPVNPMRTRLPSSAHKMTSGWP
jgi:hypothetical protein